MARKYTKLSKDLFKELVFDSGIVLNKFDPSGATEIADEDIVCDTTGDISTTLVTSYTDLGEDVNNCPTGMMELMEVENIEARLSFTALNATPEVIAMAMGVADITDNKVTPRMTIDVSKDFHDIWLVLNVMGGGMAAVHLMNALSSAGMSLTTTKRGKGQVQVEMQGHYSINAQDTVPMEYYYSAGK
jgi:hypothetical protein